MTSTARRKASPLFCKLAVKLYVFTGTFTQKMHNLRKSRYLLTFACYISLCISSYHSSMSTLIDRPQVSVILYILWTFFVIDSSVLHKSGVIAAPLHFVWGCLLSSWITKSYSHKPLLCCFWHSKFVLQNSSWFFHMLAYFPFASVLNGFNMTLNVVVWVGGNVVLRGCVETSRAQMLQSRDEIAPFCFPVGGRMWCGRRSD